MGRLMRLGNKGEFKNNLINGKGTYKWKSGKVYTGEWLDNRMHGRGVMEWSNGRRYEGEFKNDAREGYGKLTTETGEVFEGQWLDGKFMQEGSIMHNSSINDRSLSQFN